MNFWEKLLAIVAVVAVVTVIRWFLELKNLDS